MIPSDVAQRAANIIQGLGDWFQKNGYKNPYERDPILVLAEDQVAYGADFSSHRKIAEPNSGPGQIVYRYLFESNRQPLLYKKGREYILTSAYRPEGEEA